MSVLVFRTVSSGFMNTLLTLNLMSVQHTSMSFWGEMTSLCLKLYRVMISCVVICKHASMLMVP